MSSSSSSVTVLQGYLTKLGEVRKSWKKRFFCNTVDDKYTLSYYTDKTMKVLKGSIDLRLVYSWNTEREPEERGPRQKVKIILITPERTWQLIAMGSEEGDYWTSGIDKIISSLSAKDSRSSPSPAPTASAKGSSSGQVADPDSDDVEPEPVAKTPSSAPAPSSEPKQKSAVVAIAVCDYTGINDSELSFKKGDYLRIIQQDRESGWWAAELNGKKGWVSEYYLEIQQ